MTKHLDPSSYSLPEPDKSDSNKDSLRSRFLAKRESLSIDELSLYALKIGEKIREVLPKSPARIHLFLPIKRFNEVDLSLLLPILWERGDKIYVPRVINNTLEHVEILPDTSIQDNKWGIPEPLPEYPAISAQEISHINIVLTPLLVCDSLGYRVGYGGGFYDQFFQQYPLVKKIGVGFFEPIEKIIDTYAGDIPLDLYISPYKITAFKVQQ